MNITYQNFNAQRKIKENSHCSEYFIFTITLPFPTLHHRSIIPPSHHHSAIRWPHHHSAIPPSRLHSAIPPLPFVHCTITLSSFYSTISRLWCQISTSVPLRPSQSFTGFRLGTIKIERGNRMPIKYFPKCN